MQAGVADAAGVVVEKNTSLLDQIVERQADVASRYMPAMSIEQAIERHKILTRFIREILVEGEDYGKQKGAPEDAKPSLLKAGAEKLNSFFGYVPAYERIAEIEDWKGERFGEPLFYYRYKCTLSKGEPVGQGEGSCNSWEKKYRYRNGERTCPGCNKSTLIKGKAEYERDAEYKRRGAWLCFEKKGGCGEKYYGDDPAIMNQEVGRVANPDFADVINTCQKIGQKRAYVAATLSATGASQYFTQDTEDMPVDPTVEDLKREANRVDTGGAPVGTRQAAHNVAEQKIAEAKKQQAAKDKPAGRQPQLVPDDPFARNDWKGMVAWCSAQKERVGETAYRAVLREIMPNMPDEKLKANHLGDTRNFLAAREKLSALPSLAAEHATPEQSEQPEQKVEVPA